MKNDWLEQAKKRLAASTNHDTGITIDRLRAQGMINDQGEVTGHLHRWTADLAITAVKPRAGSGEIAEFRCLVPVFGMPDGEIVDVSRESLVADLRRGKQIITASHDDRLDLWMEGQDVRLSPSGFVRCDNLDDAEDNVGDLPIFRKSNSRH